MLTTTLRSEKVRKKSGDSDRNWLVGGRIPSLDGLRGISILLVMWHHAAVWCGTNWPPLIRRLGNTGSLGVDFFFVISGFLITLLLLREQRRTGTVSLRMFYLRRTLRIVPAYLVYVFVVGGFLQFTSSRLSPTEWARALTYTISLFGEPSWYIGHVWSLSVEEHFYLIWPALFLLLSKRMLFVVCIGYSAFAIVLRALIPRFTFIHASPVLFTPIRLDAIAVGCALGLAVMSRFRQRIEWSRSFAGTASILAILVMGIASAVHGLHSRVGVLFSEVGFRFVIEWCIVVVVWAAVQHPLSVPGRILNSRVLVTVGVLSYSLYFWQQPFLGPVQPNRAFELPWNVLVILLLAASSYLFVELPFLRLKSRCETTRQAKLRSKAEASVLVVSH